MRDSFVRCGLYFFNSEASNNEQKFVVLCVWNPAGDFEAWCESNTSYHEVKRNKNKCFWRLLNFQIRHLKLIFFFGVWGVCWEKWPCGLILISYIIRNNEAHKVTYKKERSTLRVYRHLVILSHLSNLNQYVTKDFQIRNYSPITLWSIYSSFDGNQNVKIEIRNFWNIWPFVFGYGTMIFTTQCQVPNKMIHQNSNGLMGKSIIFWKFEFRL